MSSKTKDELERIFAADGELAATLPDFRPREGQLQMAQRIRNTIANKTVLVAEAGTGTGKTLAYLIPALLAAHKVIISTGTRHLQDQLFYRDLPLAKAALKCTLNSALLKGRANYICTWHLERNLQNQRFDRPETGAQLERIRQFSTQTQDGDKAGFTDIPEDAPVWQYATSTRENCLNGECPHIGECFLFAARKRAMEADIVVVNHHLFFADVWLRDEGVAELLPATHTVIFDEAHQLPETAGLFFGDNLSTGQLLTFARDTRIEANIHCKDFPVLGESCDTLEKTLRDLRLPFGTDTGRWSAERFLQKASAQLQTCLDALNTVNAHLQKQAARNPAIDLAWQTGERFAEQWVRWQQHHDANLVRWLEIFSHSIAFNATPLSVAEIFSRQMNEERSWIFTSATLSVKGDFSHYCRQTGLNETDCANWDSPFCYAEQGLLFAPPDMPDPNSPGYTTAVVQAALPLILANKGRAFLLFTSLRAMREAQTLLQKLLKQKEITILMQGERPRGDLLHQFRTHPHCILLASQGFWEGVDVKGDTLSLVVIDRLPFSPPDDPVLSARIEHIKKTGGNAFMDYQLPHAVISLKQGAGRLIRDENDYGVLMICDPRLTDKPYGRRIWQSLPPMQRTRKPEEAIAFLTAHRPG